MKHIFYIPIIIFIMISINGCSKDDENSLTSPSTNGKGTLSFLLDGKVWRPKTESNFPFTNSSHLMGISPIEYDTINGNKVNDLVLINIGARHYYKNHLLIIKIDSVLNVGKYKIKEAFFSAGFDQNYNRFDTTSSSNYVEITKIHRDYKPAWLDVNNSLCQGSYTEKSYVSGTFSITLKNRFGNTVVITDGRFDLKAKDYY